MAAMSTAKLSPQESRQRKPAKKPIDSGSKPLSARQERFVDEYLVDLNGTQAAIRAGYSARTADVQAVQLLRKTKVAEAVAKRQKDREKRTEITQDRVLQEVARLAFLDIRKAFDEKGNLKPLHQLDDDTAAAVAGLDVSELTGEDANLGVLKKVKLADKTGALTLLMRHLGMLNDKMKLQGDAENPVQTVTKVVIVPPKQPAKVETKPIEKDGS
jgi:phage terminase small subunit